MIQTVLFQNSETSIPATVTLSDSIYNYDEIVLVSYAANVYAEPAYYLTSALYNGCAVGTFDDAVHLNYTITDGTTLTLANSNYGAGSKFGYVIGIKW